MRFYPLFLDLRCQKVVFSGAGDHAAAKIRLLLKTEAKISVYGVSPAAEVRTWAREGKITLFERPLEKDDLIGVRLVYGANNDLAKDRRTIEMGKAVGALTNIVDNLAESDFLTPAIVDRDPVTVAIGTEGTAPVLARKIKSEIEELLPISTGILARMAEGYRSRVAKLKSAGLRRDFWNRFFFSIGPVAFARNGASGVDSALENLFERVSNDGANPGSIAFVGTGPGDPDLVTLKARRKLHDADIVIYDRLIAPEILELARREAKRIHIGTGGTTTTEEIDGINALIINQAKAGAKIVRLKFGDPAVFGRLDDEMEFVSKAAVDWEIVPGIAAAADLRNASHAIAKIRSLAPRENSKPKMGAV